MSQPADQTTERDERDIYFQCAECGRTAISFDKPFPSRCVECSVLELVNRHKSRSETTSPLTRFRLLTTPSYKPGAWADVQRKAGIKQVQCPTCGLWRTPQELSTREVRWTARDKRARQVEFSEFQCAKCAEAEKLNQ